MKLRKGFPYIVTRLRIAAPFVFGKVWFKISPEITLHDNFDRWHKCERLSCHLISNRTLSYPRQKETSEFNAWQFAIIISGVPDSFRFPVILLQSDPGADLVADVNLLSCLHSMGLPLSIVEMFLFQSLPIGLEEPGRSLQTTRSCINDPGKVFNICLAIW